MSKSKDLDGKQIEWVRLPMLEGRKLMCAHVGCEGVKSITLQDEYSGEYSTLWALVETEDKRNFRINMKYAESHAMPEED